jgi:hypothetical protein
LWAAVVVVNATATDDCSVGVPTGVRSDGLALNANYPELQHQVERKITLEMQQLK